jgi:hypothetical protein
MRRRSLLVVATLAWVAPLSAHSPVATHHAKGECPKAKAKAAAATTTAKADATRQPGGSNGSRANAAPADVPGEGSVFAIGRGSSFLMP